MMSELREIPCHIDGMDEIVGGFKSPSIILIAGTAGVGKTTMALQMLSNAAKAGEKSLYIPITTENSDRLKMYLSTFEFLDESVEVHEINRPIAEKDPLSTLIEMDNTISAAKPDRLVIDPITPIGFGFVEQERRRFFYTLDSMVRESNSLVFLTGELMKDEIHSYVVSHLADGIIYLSRANQGMQTSNQMEILKMTGTKPPYSNECMTQKFNYMVSTRGFRAYPNLKYEEQAPEDKKVEIGIDEFDKMLNGGVPKGSSILVGGEPGTGKTIMGWQFIQQGLENGENCAIITFYESVDQIIKATGDLGWDLQPYIDEGKLSIITYDTENVCYAEYSNRISNIVEEKKPARLLIDGLVNVEITIMDPVKRRGFLHSLVGYLKSHDVTTLFTTELFGGAEKIRSKESSFIMDNVILLKQTDTEKGMKRQFQIIKSRGTASEPLIKEYEIKEGGIEII
jgi:circadian clock protein KaiC